MNILLDTNAYTHFQKSQPSIVKALSEADRVYVPAVVLGELYYGFEAGSQKSYNEKLLEEFLQSQRIEILTVELRTAQIYGHLRAYLKSQATPIPINDIWIAALAVQYGLSILSLDAHFNHLPQVELISLEK